MFLVKIDGFVIFDNFRRFLRFFDRFLATFKIIVLDFSVILEIGHF